MDAVLAVAEGRQPLTRDLSNLNPNILFVRSSVCQGCYAGTGTRGMQRLELLPVVFPYNR